MPWWMRAERRASPSPHDHPAARRPWLGGYALPALILALALGLRLWRLGGANLWWDEALAVWAVRKGLVGVTLWTASDVHPPLFFWSLWAWVQAFGESEFAMRSLTAFVGVLTVAVVYALGRLAGGRRAGALAALFIALARFHIWWSQEMRMYALAGLLGVLSLYLFLRWLRAEGQYRADDSAPPEKRPALLLLAGCALAQLGALYTVYISIVFVLAENLVLLAALWRPTGGKAACKRLFWRWAPAEVAVAALVMVWLALSWGRMRSWEVGSATSLAFVARLYATLLTSGVSVDIDRVTWAIWPALAVLAGGLVCLLRARPARSGAPRAALLIGLVVFLGGAMIYVATQPRGLFYVPDLEARYFLPYAPAFWLLLGWSAAALTRHWRAVGWGATAVLVALSLYFLPGYYADRFRHDELQSMVRAILSQAGPDDVVLLDSGGRYPLFLYYYERAAGDGPHPTMETVTLEERNVTADEVAACLTSEAESHGRIWLAEVDVALGDPERLAKAWLDAHSTAVLSHGYGYNALYLYDPLGQPPELAADYAPQYPLAASLGGGRLRGWELAERTATPGDAVRIVTVWDAAPAATIAIELWARGETVLRRELDAGEAAGGPWRQELDWAVPAGWPAGRYEIVLVAGDDRLTLGTLQVAGAPKEPALGPAAQPLGVHIGADLTLAGYTLHSDQAQAGGNVVLDLYWRADAAPGRDLNVFVHLLGESYNPATQGPVWGQTDGAPNGGTEATATWQAGDWIVDRHVIPLDAAAPAGSYQIELGLVQPEDGARLPVTAADGTAQGDHLILPQQVAVTAP
jgi:mannosyltransferase